MALQAQRSPNAARKADVAREEQLLTDVLSYAYDPAGYVSYIFPWEEPGTPLEHEAGPDTWQLEVMDYVAEAMVTSADPIRIAIASGHGPGKAQPCDLVIDTPDGGQCFGELVVGSRVFGANGSPVEVLGVFPQGHKLVYRVAFDDGTSTLACADHLWTVRGRQQRRGQTQPGWITRTTADLLALGVKRKNGVAQARQWEIPTIAPVDYPFCWVPIDPYTLGYWIGDGSAHSGLITTMDPEPVERIRRAGYAVNEMQWAKLAGHTARTYNIAGIQESLRRVGLYACRSHERFLPASYRQNIVPIRLDLLQGLMDSDGYITPDGAPLYTSVSERLATDVAWLVRSLGGKARVSKALSKGYRDSAGFWHHGRPAYIVSFALDGTFPIVTVARKVARYRPTSQKRYVSRWIDRIEPVGMQDCQCIAVAAPDGLYACNDFIVTHNTALLAWFIKWFASTKPHPQIPVTASTGAQLSTKTWRELAKWHGLALDQHWFTWTATKYARNAFPDTWYASAIPWSKDKAQSFAGTHEEHVLIIFDEASTIDDAIWEVVDGAMSTPGAIWLAFGNPEQPTGRFRDCFGRFRGLWKTWQIDARTAKKTNKEEIARQIAAYGDDSDFVRVRWLGKFPRQGPTQFISEALVEAAQARTPEGYEHMPKILGVDVARFGDAQTVLIVRQGLAIVYGQGYRGLRTDQTADLVAALLDKDSTISMAFIDVVGVGAGVVDQLIRLGYRRRVTGVNGGAAGTEPLPQSTTLKYFNLRAEMWGKMRDWLEAGGCLPPHMVELAQDLPGPQFGYAREQCIQLERKEDMAARGVASPDCFVAGTLVDTPAGPQAIDTLAPGCWVHTPMGPRMVLRVVQSRACMLTTATFSNGCRLTGKGSHRIFTWNAGWIRLDALSLVNDIESNAAWRRWVWAFLGQLYMPVKPFGFKHQVDTIVQGGRMRRRDFFIGASTQTTMGLFLTGMKSIIRMMIGRIALWTIWYWWSRENTAPSIVMRAWRTLRSGRGRLKAWRWRRSGPRSGMGQRLAGPGIASMVSSVGRIASLLTFHVSDVAHSFQRFSRRGRDFVPNPVSKRSVINTIRQLQGTVRIVGKCLSTTSIARKPVVPLSVVTVPAQPPVVTYNLTLDGDNVYYANGILVENCGDALSMTFARPVALQAHERPVVPPRVLPIARRRTASGGRGGWMR